MHGQYPRILEKPHKDTVITNIWLSSHLKGETEGLLAADKDQAINTRNYQKVICGQQVESKCRICSQHEETVDHIVSGCIKGISQNKRSPGTIRLQPISTGAFVKIMISRLQTNGTGISQRLCCTLKTTTSPLCRTGQSILIKLIAANRPDIIVKDLLNSSCKLWNQIETSH